MVCERTIDSHVKKLRWKLVDPSPHAPLSHSVYGAGYEFEAEEERCHHSRTTKDIIIFSVYAFFRILVTVRGKKEVTTCRIFCCLVPR